MEEEYGQASPLTVSCGKIPNYLGMTLDFSELHHVVVQMSDYVKPLLQGTPSDMDGIVMTPVAAVFSK